MSMTVLAIALANDDPWPDHICPGCGNDITGWPNHRSHYARRSADRKNTREFTARRRSLGLDWPFTSDVVTPTSGSVGDVCGWTRDYLVARYLRRLYILEHS